MNDGPISELRSQPSPPEQPTTRPAYFRSATPDDAPLLYEWRTQAETQGWWNGTPTSYQQHLAWLLPRLNNPLVKILLWEQDGEPSGMVRIDSNGELAFEAKDDDTAIRMLSAASAFADAYGGRLKAAVDADDPKWRLLERAGFAEYPAHALVFKPTERN